MKVLGITAEYNPFHNGHKYHIEKSREITGSDCVVAVMSGNFTQRGEATTLDKWERSRLAVDNGVDLVIELPFIYACSRAQSFACGAVDILKGFGAQTISFGSESGDINNLLAYVEAFDKNADRISLARQRHMQGGLSFAKASEMAVEEIIGGDAASLMLEPNNILAIEYLRRINYWNNRGLRITPVTIKRHGSGYHGENSKSGFAGASRIRNMESPSEFKKYVPDDVSRKLQGTAKCALHAEERFFHLVRSEIVKSSPEALAKVHYMGEGLENKFKKEIMSASDMKGFIDSVVSKRYTEAAVRRILTYVLMGIREYELPKAVYGRVLAAGEKGRKLLSTVKKQDEHLPIITNINKDETDNYEVQACLKYDVLASDMYNLIYNRNLYAYSDKVIRPYMADF